MRSPLHIWKRKLANIRFVEKVGPNLRLSWSCLSRQHFIAQVNGLVREWHERTVSELESVALVTEGRMPT